MSSDTEWQKATKSGQSGNCVEMRRRQGRVEMQDSKARGEGLLSMPCSSFEVLLVAAQRGELDQLR